MEKLVIIIIIGIIAIGGIVFYFENQKVTQRQEQINFNKQTELRKQNKEYQTCIDGIWDDPSVEQIVKRFTDGQITREEYSSFLETSRKVNCDYLRPVE